MEDVTTHTCREVVVAGRLLGYFTLEIVDYPETGHSCDCCVFHNEMGCNVRETDLWTAICKPANSIWRFGAV